MLCSIVANFGTHPLHTVVCKSDGQYFQNFNEVHFMSKIWNEDTQWCAKEMVEITIQCVIFKSQHWLKVCSPEIFRD